MRSKTFEKGRQFESVIKELCAKIADNERINAKVETCVQLLGNDGATHEIDVLYSFEHIGLNYRVAIECKNWKNPINVCVLRNFAYKLEHIGNINGIFISAESGFQDGAQKVSDYNGIKIVKYDEFDMFINGQQEKYFKPDFKTIGDPFWMIMDLHGINSIECNWIVEYGILLFESKYFAEQFLEVCLQNNDNLKVVGVSQQHLKEIASLKKKRVPIKLFNPYTTNLSKVPYHFWDLNIKDIEMYIRV